MNHAQVRAVKMRCELPNLDLSFGRWLIKNYRHQPDINNKYHTQREKVKAYRGGYAPSSQRYRTARS